MKYVRLIGDEARPYLEQLASLRLKVFWEFPYLYEGTLAYEKNYLETYFRANHSFIFLVVDGDKVVGATTGVRASEGEESFRVPFEEQGMNPKHIFYYGESVLLHEYRGLGIGKKFFEERENFARQLGSISHVSFCAVERAEDHPFKPADYKPLDPFWRSLGFEKMQGVTTIYEWQDRGNVVPSNKVMQFWIKQL